MTPDISALRTVKLVHTVVWALFAGCIVAIPYFAWIRRLDTAAVLIAIVTVEDRLLMGPSRVDEQKVAATVARATRLSHPATKEGCE